MSRAVLRFETEVTGPGRVEVDVPIPPGSRVVVVFEEPEDSFADLTAAARTSTDFWDNPLDDEDWSEA